MNISKFKLLTLKILSLCAFALHFSILTLHLYDSASFLMSKNSNDARQLCILTLRTNISTSRIIFISCSSSRLKIRWIIMHHLKIMKIASTLWFLCVDERRKRWINLELIFIKVGSIGT